MKKIFLTIAFVLLGAFALIAAQGDYWTSGYDSGNGRSPWRVDSSGNLIPGADDTYDLGDTTHEIQDIYIDGTATIDALTVDGATTMTGAATLNNAVTISGNTTVTGTFSLTGDQTISKTLAVTGTTALTGATTVTGTTTLNNTVAISGNTSVAGTFALTGDITVSKTMAVTGKPTFTTGIQNTGYASIPTSGWAAGAVIYYTGTGDGLGPAGMYFSSATVTTASCWIKM